MDPQELKRLCQSIIDKHRIQLTEQIILRREEMKQDADDHFVLYRVLGIEETECSKIDLYQNIGRFVYKYAGAMLEELTFVVMEVTKGGRKISIQNTMSSSPARFDIDCYVGSDNKAHEIKWRDATTDGDHIKKETNKILAIAGAGHIPIKLMYFFPQRSQAAKIQTKMIALYRQKGEAYIGEDAWKYVHEYTGFDLKGLLLEQIKQ